jgi:hypothetical protein
MITKIDGRKTKRQTNTKTFLKNYDLIENKIKTNYETQFSISLISMDEIEQK